LPLEAGSFKMAVSLTASPPSIRSFHTKGDSRMKSTAECKSLLECAIYWEKAGADRMCFSQPMGGGDANIKTWTWAEAVGDARKMASYLKSLDLPERSSIALFSKNCAHWLMADLAIWMAGHVSVPIYPILTADIVTYTLEHSESKLLFVGKLDPVWDDMKQGVPAGLKTVAFPLAPENEYEQWDDIITNHSPLMEIAACPADETATIIYTSGSTGKPKGAMISFEAMYRSGRGLSEYLKTNPGDRMLSYLPLAHVYERFVGQAQSLYAGFPLFFAGTRFYKTFSAPVPPCLPRCPGCGLNSSLVFFKKCRLRNWTACLRFRSLKTSLKRRY
jgi:long-chain acyl-CoA synthetase